MTFQTKAISEILRDEKDLLLSLGNETPKTNISCYCCVVVTVLCYSYPFPFCGKWKIERASGSGERGVFRHPW